MVLESLIKPDIAEKKPLKLITIGFVYAIVSILLSLWIFSFKEMSVRSTSSIFTGNYWIPLLKLGTHGRRYKWMA